MATKDGKGSAANSRRSCMLAQLEDQEASRCHRSTHLLAIWSGHWAKAIDLGSVTLGLGLAAFASGWLGGGVNKAADCSCEADATDWWAQFSLTLAKILLSMSLCIEAAWTRVDVGGCRWVGLMVD